MLYFQRQIKLFRGYQSLLDEYFADFLFCHSRPPENHLMIFLSSVPIKCFLRASPCTRFQTNC